jgi:hypothetical protein
VSGWALTFLTIFKATGFTLFNFRNCLLADLTGSIATHRDSLFYNFLLSYHRKEQEIQSERQLFKVPLREEIQNRLSKKKALSKKKKSQTLYK